MSKKREVVNTTAAALDPKEIPTVMGIAGSNPVAPRTIASGLIFSKGLSKVMESQVGSKQIPMSWLKSVIRVSARR
ncbi:hypothetical protein [Yersinia enterocolitica]|uniref:hypothetical protein n=1 Tax=Yersinia enterocolitica TaxID=630 RepID=UPI0002819A61|nr:hypothetical protein [Yersinia enterocolitica]EKA26324.1 hypothetical protein YWA314_14939 [Yersinia enterocolitica subsp. enterocolitica WA-314]ELI8281658.1 hypothetical protein [Yersinia enterocolitica]PNM13269.1 hypothetical protein A6J64_015185 [Yersinia enterocolitica]PNM15977.1 hypothetical protein A6J63_008685 [Yersinia enterocolitica]PNM20069.1 hypothetical protein A6J65_015205 [Yersinia enterocolitica]